MSFTRNINRFIVNDLKLPEGKCEVVKVHKQTKERAEFFKVKQCHTNCKLTMENMAQLNRPGYYEPVTCWIVYGAKEIVLDCKAQGVTLTKKNGPRPTDFEAEFHCVLRNTESGQLIDVTPDVNPKRVVRRIVLEPRMTAECFEKFGFPSPENIVTKAWGERYPLPAGSDQPDFFQQLAMLKILKSVKHVVRLS